MGIRHARKAFLATANLVAASFALAGCAPRLDDSFDPRVHSGGSPESFGTVAMRANEAPARITRIWLSSRTAAWGDSLRVRVTATSNVALVEVREFGYGRALRKRGIGMFSGIIHVPALPPYLHPQFRSELRFIARAVESSDEVRTVLSIH